MRQRKVDVLDLAEEVGIHARLHGLVVRIAPHGTADRVVHGQLDSNVVGLAAGVKDRIRRSVPVHVVGRVQRVVVLLNVAKLARLARVNLEVRASCISSAGASHTFFGNRAGGAAS